MKAIFIEHNRKPNSSFAVREFEGTCFDYPLHFHPQYELTYIVKGSGTRFVGNSIDSFNDGELVLLGQNLVHCWRSDPEYYSGNETSGVSCIVVQFSHDFLGNHFFNIPENFRIKKLLIDATSGFKISSESSKFVINRLERLIHAKETERIIILVEILYEISKRPEFTKPISFGQSSQNNERGLYRINNVISYVSEQFQNNISLDDAAKIANMNKTAFCKFFKKNTQKSFIEFVNEVRIGFACQKLREGQLSITEICYLSGYNNFSNFSRMFKKFTSFSPSQYVNTVKLQKSASNF